MHSSKYSRRMILAGTIMGAMLATAAQAALPPKYQRLRELEAILATTAIAAAFPDSEVIVKIEYVRPDQYRVSSANCHMPVLLEDEPMPSMMAGPRRFSVKPGSLVCDRPKRRR